MNSYDFTFGDESKRKPELFIFREKVLILLLLLACMDFYAYGMHIMVILFAMYYLMGGRVQFVRGVGATALLSMSVLLFWEGSLDGPSAITQWLVWPMAYLLGYSLTVPASTELDDITKAGKKANYYFLIIALGFFIHLILNIFYNNGDSSLGTNVVEIERNTIDFWTKEVRSATGQATFACIPLAWCVASFIKNPSFKNRLPAIIGLVIILHYNLTLSTRTIFLMTLILVVLSLCYMISFGSGEQKKLRTVLGVFVVVLVVAIVYQFDLFDLRTAVEDSGFFARFFERDSQDITEDTRMDSKLKYFKYFPMYLWGGGHIRRIVGNYAHDVFLDTYDEAGVFALIAVIILIWNSVKVLLRVIKNKYIDFNTRLTSLCVFAALYIEFMVEPIFAGSPGLLMAFCFLCGMITRLDINAAYAEKQIDEDQALQGG